MNISFTGNYLFNLRNENTRNEVQQKFENPEGCVMNSVVLPIENKKLLVLTGKEYKDYDDMLYFYKCTGFDTELTREALKNSYVNCAQPVNLSKVNSDGKEVKPGLQI